MNEEHVNFMKKISLYRYLVMESESACRYVVIEVRNGGLYTRITRGGVIVESGWLVARVTGAKNSGAKIKVNEELAIVLVEVVFKVLVVVAVVLLSSPV